MPRCFEALAPRHVRALEVEAAARVLGEGALNRCISRESRAGFSRYRRACTWRARIPASIGSHRHGRVVTMGARVGEKRAVVDVSVARPAQVGVVEHQHRSERGRMPAVRCADHSQEVHDWQQRLEVPRSKPVLQRLLRLELIRRRRGEVGAAAGRIWDIGPHRRRATRREDLGIRDGRHLPGVFRRLTERPATKPRVEKFGCAKGDLRRTIQQRQPVGDHGGTTRRS